MVGWEPETVQTVQGLPVVGPTSVRVGKIKAQFGTFVSAYLEDCKPQIPATEFEQMQSAFREYMQAPHDALRFQNFMYSINNASRHEESVRGPKDDSRIGRLKPVISKFNFWNENPNEYRRADALETSIQTLAFGAHERQESKALILAKNDPYTENLTSLLTELRLTELPSPQPAPAVDTWKPPVKTAEKKGIPPVPEQRARPTQRIADDFTHLVNNHLQTNGTLYRSAEKTDALVNAFGQYMRGEISKASLDKAFTGDKTIADIRHSIDAFHQWREDQTPANARAFGAALITHAKDQETRQVTPYSESPDAKKPIQNILKTLLDSVPPEHQVAPPKASQSAGIAPRNTPQR
jgi:hypothetical protein